LAAPPELPATVRKMLEQSSKRLRLPRNSEDYQTSFTLLLQGSE
jgi:hypothetical protein